MKAEMFLVIRQREAAPMAYQGPMEDGPGWLSLNNIAYGYVMIYSTRRKAEEAIDDLPYKIGKLCSITSVIIDLGLSNSQAEQKQNT